MEDFKMLFQVSSGLLAPIECQIAVSKFVKEYCAQIDEDLKIIQTYKYGGHDEVKYDNARSIIFESDNTYFMHLIGTIKCVFKSPIRMGYKKKSWFIAFNRILIGDLNDIASISFSDVKYETFRNNCYADGQYVNTTDSAVKAIHKPTGITVIAQEERSQHMNKKLAYKRLQLELWDYYNIRLTEEKKRNWDYHNEITRGNEKLTVKFKF